MAQLKATIYDARLGKEVIIESDNFYSIAKITLTFALTVIPIFRSEFQMIICDTENESVFQRDRGITVPRKLHEHSPICQTHPDTVQKLCNRV